MISGRWMISLLAAALLALSACGPSKPAAGLLSRRAVTLEPKPVPQPPPPPKPAEPPPPPSVRLTVVGDLMLARRPGEAVARGVDPFAGFAGVLAEADIAVGNLECVIATVGQQVPKAYNFRCHPRNVPLLARYFEAVSVANNHSGDYGKEAFAEQLDLLKRGGVAFFGGGRNLAEAHTPLILERSGLRIALLGYNEVELRSFEAGPERPGLAWSEDQQVKEGIRAARETHKADLVVIYPHWGVEYQSNPSERQRSLARLMIDSGADLVVGAHPHVTQTVEWYKGRLIVYSLGNFVFDDFLDVPASLNEPSRTSWVLRVTMTREGVQRFDTLVARTDDDGIPRPLTGVSSPCGQAGKVESCQR